MPVATLQQLILHDLGDIYDAEHRFLEAQQKMRQQATDLTLTQMIGTHIQQTESQIANIEKVFSQLGEQPKREKCDAAEGIVNEGSKAMKEASAAGIRDLAIIQSIAKVEHYEMASYRGLIASMQAYPRGSGSVDLLRQNLQQEEQTAQLAERALTAMLQNAG